MRCAVRSERQVTILATGLLCYWWRLPSSSGLKGLCFEGLVSVSGVPALDPLLCWYLHEDLECASAVPFGFGGSFTHIGDHRPLFLRGVRCPFLGSLHY